MLTEVLATLDSRHVERHAAMKGHFDRQEAAVRRQNIALRGRVTVFLTQWRLQEATAGNSGGWLQDRHPGGGGGGGGGGGESVTADFRRRRSAAVGGNEELEVDEQVSDGVVVCWRLHPYVLEAASLRARGYSPMSMSMCESLQPIADAQVFGLALSHEQQVLVHLEEKRTLFATTNLEMLAATTVVIRAQITAQRRQREIAAARAASSECTEQLASISGPIDALDRPRCGGASDEQLLAGAHNSPAKLSSPRKQESPRSGSSSKPCSSSKPSARPNSRPSSSTALTEPPASRTLQPSPAQGRGGEMPTPLHPSTPLQPSPSRLKKDATRSVGRPSSTSSSQAKRPGTR